MRKTTGWTWLPRIRRYEALLGGYFPKAPVSLATFLIFRSAETG
jgi:hypothetical protein